MDNKTLDIFETMNELYETVQNNLVLVCNKWLFKNLKNKNWRDVQLSAKQKKSLKEALEERARELLESVNNATSLAFKTAGLKPNKTFIATNAKAMGFLIGSARNYYNSTVTRVWRLSKGDDIKKELIKQSKLGYEKGLPIKINNRNYEYKSYMEMAARTTMSHDIIEQQMELNLETQNVFYIVNAFGDCAKDHVNLQGKMYYDKRYKSFDMPKEVKDKVASIIENKQLMSMQEAIEKPYWLTTRPNCRHRFVPITIEQASGNREKLLEDLKLKRGTYKTKKYEITQELRYIERQIRKYKALLENAIELYSSTKDESLKVDIDKYSDLVKEWQKRARLLVKKANEKEKWLERDYERESRRVIIKDLGVKYLK